jgi:hypothetical protein
MSCWSSTYESSEAVHSSEASEDLEGPKVIKGSGTRSMSRADVSRRSNSWTVKERGKGVGWAP